MSSIPAFQPPRCLELIYSDADISTPARLSLLPSASTVSRPITTGAYQQCSEPYPSKPGHLHWIQAAWDVAKEAEKHIREKSAAIPADCSAESWLDGAIREYSDARSEADKQSIPEVLLRQVTPEDFAEAKAEQMAMQETMKAVRALFEYLSRDDRSSSAEGDLAPSQSDGEDQAAMDCTK